MENKTTGSFLSALRKASGMTQQEVADKLNVSNKTVSKWERDEGYPEITMLPALAEFYGVTVDEILRGERSTRFSESQYNQTKSEERLKLIIRSSRTKFTNTAVVSLVLALAALLLIYTIGDIIYNNNFLWVGYVIIILLSGASVISAFIAINNLMSRLHSEETAHNQLCCDTIKHSSTYFTAIIFLNVITLLGLILSILMRGASFLFVSLPATAIAAGVAAYFVRKLYLKKYNISEDELPTVVREYRKKHFKITTIVISAVLICTLAFPFVSMFIDARFTDFTFSFSEAVGYQYESYEEAQREYNKLKAVLEGERTIYSLEYEDFYEPDTYVLILSPLAYGFDKTDKGYQMIYTEATFTEEMQFDSAEAMEEFKKENVYSDDSAHIGSLQKNVTLDDETLTVKYKYNRNFISQALDIFPLFLIGGSCLFLLGFGISFIVYTKKKGLLMAME